ncbi:phosphate signaling complex protein PhoU [Mycobacterium sp. E3198]|uniref:phosphate signaling complex protein PhoU n=1 Tax=Mycobacterium sp. E3198 TaxID=1834143 RepID=UPI0007FE6616|nr:phosphate signaling complex protein PhoU [Mycobacterium sp. E3198]OBG27117.1 phosphate transport system regulatory protein PhoU [Mycobacterium sp. E3198]
MRTAYHRELDDLAARLGEMCGLAGVAMKRATQALLEADIEAAERVIRDHERIVEMRAQAEKEAFALLALQQPVAGELRAIFSSIQIIADTERMGALAVHVAEIARREYPKQALPDDVRGCFAEMGKVAIALGDSAKRVLVSRDPEQAAQLREQDEAMDELYRQLFAALIDRNWRHTVAAGVEAALLGRFYERFADHAVEIGRRVIFMDSGVLPAEDEIP